MLRPLLVRLHRYVGLSLAVFLTVVALTGSVIAFNEELDALLNPQLFRAPAGDLPAGADTVVRRIEHDYRSAQVTYIPLNTDPGKAVRLRVESRGGGSVAFDEVFASASDGQALGTRKWGECCLDARHLVPFLYRTHYTLLLPGNWGILFTGTVALVWFVDCIVGLALTLPRATPFWRNWRKAWVVKRGASRLRIHFDLHRAAGLWLWLVLAMLAMSGVALKLPQQVFRPVVSLFCEIRPSVEDTVANHSNSTDEGQETRVTQTRPTLSFNDAITRAAQEAGRRNWSIHPQYAFRLTHLHAYGVAFLRDGQTPERGLGPSFFYLDDRSGALLDSDIMAAGSAGDVFIQAQYPLHSGRIAGLPGRTLVSVTGLAVVLLTWTGIYIWLRKRRVAAAHLRREPSPARARGALASVLPPRPS